MSFVMDERKMVGPSRWDLGACRGGGGGGWLMKIKCAGVVMVVMVVDEEFRLLGRWV